MLIPVSGVLEDECPIHEGHIYFKFVYDEQRWVHRMGIEGIALLQFIVTYLFKYSQVL